MTEEVEVLNKDVDELAKDGGELKRGVEKFTWDVNELIMAEGELTNDVDKLTKHTEELPKKCTGVN